MKLKSELLKQLYKCQFELNRKKNISIHDFFKIYLNSYFDTNKFTDDILIELSFSEFKNRLNSNKNLIFFVTKNNLLQHIIKSYYEYKFFDLYSLINNHINHKMIMYSDNYNDLNNDEYKIFIFPKEKENELKEKLYSLREQRIRNRENSYDSHDEFKLTQIKETNINRYKHRIAQTKIIVNAQLIQFIYEGL